MLRALVKAVQPHQQEQALQQTQQALQVLGEQLRDQVVQNVAKESAEELDKCIGSEEDCSLVRLVKLFSRAETDKIRGKLGPWQALLGRGTDINLRGEDGETLLHVALAAGAPRGGDCPVARPRC